MRKLNFSAGPCILPVEVLEEIRDNVVDFKGHGISLIESSHRHKYYEEVHNSAINLLKELLNVPENYSVLFLGGGATLTFTMIPMNFIGAGQTADYVLSGAWAKKAYDDAEKLGKTKIVFDGKDNNYTTLPDPDSLKTSEASAYLHITSNETIGGLQWKDWPETGNVPLICDMSSDIMSREIPVKKFAMIYGGVQKNLGPAGAAFMIIRDDLLERSPDSLPAYLNFKLHASKNAMYNTPPVFSIWAVELFLEWVKKNGGVAEMQRRADQKSSLLYKTIDESDGFFLSPVDPRFRSTMNVVFRLKDEGLEKEFLEESEKEGMMFLKGHRSVGGCRASIYNAMPLEMVETLSGFMKTFLKRKG